MDNDGQVVFGIRVAPPKSFFSPKQNVIRTARSYNDGHWHQVATTYDGSTMTL